jgi:prophage antirepressor-like protein
LGKDDFIPENLFYRLAWRANNETALRFQALVAETVNRYLDSFGFCQQVGKDDFIPEGMFWRLAMKANADGRQLTNI